MTKWVCFCVCLAVTTVGGAANGAWYDGFGLVLNGIVGSDRSPSSGAEASPPDTTKPTVVGASAVDSTSVRLIFSESMDSSTVVTLSDYTFTGGLQVSAVTIISETTVDLTVSEMAFNTPYVVTVWTSGPADLAGNHMDPDANTAEFVLPRRYALADTTAHLYTDTTGDVPLWPCWSPDGTKVAFSVTDTTTALPLVSDLHISDLASGATQQLLDVTARVSGVDDLLGFTFDGDSLLFPQHVPASCEGGELRVLSGCSTTAPLETRSGIVHGTDLNPSLDCPLIGHGDVFRDGAVDKLLLYLQDWPANETFSVDLDASGDAVLSSVRPLVTAAAELVVCRMRVSPDGDSLLVVQWMGTTNFDILLITDLQAMLKGQTQPIASLDDPRIHWIERGTNYADACSWSQDGSLIFYSEDFNGVMDATRWNFAECDFDIVVVRLEDVLADAPIPSRISLPNNQGCVRASRGGTRFALVEFSGLSGGIVEASSLEITDAAYLTCSSSTDGVTTRDFRLRDGSGAELFVPTGTTVHAESGFEGFGTVPEPALLVSTFTPITPVDEALLTAGVIGIPVVRAFAPAGTTFSPAAQLTLSYTDEEIEGLAEEGLVVYQYNPISGQFDIELPVSDRDLEGNRITVQIESFGEASGGKAGSGVGLLGVGGKADGDGDGLSDDVEEALGTDPDSADTDHDGLSDYQEVYWDGDGALNAYDPDINPTGMDLNPLDADTDGDGVRDGSEAEFGSDPLDPADTVELSIDGWAAAVLLVLLAGWMVRRGAFVRRDPR